MKRILLDKSFFPDTRLRTPSLCCGCRRSRSGPWPYTLRDGPPDRVSVLFRRCTRTWWTTAPRPSTFSCGRRTVFSRVSSARRTCWPNTSPRSRTRKPRRSSNSPTSRCSTGCSGCCRSGPTCSTTPSTSYCHRYRRHRRWARCDVWRSGVSAADRSRSSGRTVRNSERRPRTARCCRSAASCTVLRTPLVGGDTRNCWISLSDLKRNVTVRQFITVFF